MLSSRCAYRQCGTVVRSQPSNVRSLHSSFRVPPRILDADARVSQSCCRCEGVESRKRRSLSTSLIGRTTSKNSPSTCRKVHSSQFCLPRLPPCFVICIIRRHIVSVSSKLLASILSWVTFYSECRRLAFPLCVVDCCLYHR